VRVLYTTWENGVLADPPMARLEVLEGSPTGTPGEELEFAWIAHPQQAQGRCFRIWVGTETFLGRLIQNIQRYQGVPCPGTIELLFRGTALQAEPITDIWPWRIRVEEVISGPLQAGQEISVDTSSLAGCSGSVDPDLREGVRVEIFGRFLGYDPIRQVETAEVCSDARYYIRVLAVPPVQAELTVDRGCGAAYVVGDPIVVTTTIQTIDPQVFGQSAAPFRLLDVLPDDTQQVFDLGVLGEGQTSQIEGTITPPVGTEMLILQVLMPNGQWQDVTRCSFQVIGTGQVLLAIRARIPQGEVAINMELFINPPSGGFMVITTPYQQSWPQNTSIRLEAPATINPGGQEYAFDHWEVTRVTATGQTGTFVLTQNPLEAPLVSPQVTIIAVYVDSG